MINRILGHRKPAEPGKPKPLETVVTFLEMKARPSHRHPRPVNVNAVLLHASKPPLHFYRYLYFHVGIHWNWEARLRLTDKQLAKAIHAETTDIHVLFVDGAPAGYFEINRDVPGTSDIAYFGMMPHVHGMGLGKWFLGAAIDAAWSNEPDRVTVNTCTLDHPAALPLYQKLGFRPYRQSKGRVFSLSDNELAALGVRDGIIGS